MHGFILVHAFGSLSLSAAANQETNRPVEMAAEGLMKQMHV